MRVAVILNGKSGSVGADQCEQKASAIAQAFSQVGVHVTMHRCDPADLVATARGAAALGVDAVVAAGGDGTVSAVASALAGTEMPLAVLPMGTLNHFARDLGMPTDLVDAARAIAEGELTAVDVAMVNDRVLVNNSSIGLYAAAIVERDEDQKRTGATKWVAMARAAWKILRQFPRLRVKLTVGDRELTGRMPIVFIGNNEFIVEPLGFGKRARLDGGVLSIYAARSRNAVSFLWHSLRAVFGRAEQVADLEVLTGTKVCIESSQRTLRVAVDGEVVHMTSPLHYEIRPGALRVIAPRAAESRAAA